MCWKPTTSAPWYAGWLRCVPGCQGLDVRRRERSGDGIHAWMAPFTVPVRSQGDPQVGLVLTRQPRCSRRAGATRIRMTRSAQSQLRRRSRGRARIRLWGFAAAGQEA